MTGYTARLVEKDLNCKQWIMCCARAFAPYIDMRDESLDVSTPTELKVNEYYITYLCEARKKLAILKVMDRQTAIKYGQEHQNEWLTILFQQQKDEQFAIDKMTRMLAKVKAWVPPTLEHTGLKEFMISQLEDSLKYKNLNYYAEEIQRWATKDPLTIYNEQLEFTREEVQRAENTYKKECERIEYNNRWIKTLVQSMEG